MRALVLEQRATDHVVHAIGVSESIAPVARADPSSPSRITTDGSRRRSTASGTRDDGGDHDGSGRTPSGQSHRARGCRACRGRHALRITPRGASGRCARRGSQHGRDGAGHQAHPELKLARWAARLLDADVARQTTMYTSCQPCPMCAAAIARSGLGRVVFALSGDQLQKLKPPGALSPTRRRWRTTAQRCSLGLAFRSTATTPRAHPATGALRSRTGRTSGAAHRAGSPAALSCRQPRRALLSSQSSAES